MTSDNPQANHLAPLIFNWLLIASVTSPYTTEVLTPPFSNTLPFAITLVLPPPPSGLSAPRSGGSPAGTQYHLYMAFSGPGTISQVLPAKAVAVKVPVDGLKDNLVEDTF